MKDLHILGNILEQYDNTGILPEKLKKNDVKKLYKIFFTLFFESKIYIKEKRIINFLRDVCKIKGRRFALYVRRLEMHGRNAKSD